MGRVESLIRAGAEMAKRSPNRVHVLCKTCLYEHTLVDPNAEPECCPCCGSTDVQAEVVAAAQE